jgi:hypothetical protein
MDYLTSPLSHFGVTLSSSEGLAVSLDEYDDDVTGWINDLLDGLIPVAPGFIEPQSPQSPPTQSSDVSELDKRVGSLVRRLEIACQDTSAQVEQTIEDISRAVPRLTYDLQFMRESALTLQRALQEVEAKIHPESDSSADVTSDTSAALEQLFFLSTVKSRMESSREVLREAENWSTLEPEVSSLLASQSYQKASERLAEASKSMALFQNTPEFESRKALMVSLQNQLEAALSSALVAAINSRDVVGCKNYYSIFSGIQREAEFQNYYFGSRRKSLVKLWQEAKVADCEGEIITGADLLAEDGSAAQDITITFNSLLTKFFSEFSSLINEERTYIPSIFPDAQQTISLFIQSTLDSLSPSLSERLSGVAEYYEGKALIELNRAFRTAEEFAIATDKVMEKVGYSALFSAPTPTVQQSEDGGKGHQRRLSKRMSISRRMGGGVASRSISIGNGSNATQWEQALFEAFIDFQSDYPSLEKKFLESELGSIVAMGRTRNAAENSDGAHFLRERAMGVFGAVEEALDRCMEFTHGYGAIGLIQDVDYIFERFLAESKADLIVTPRKSSPASPASDDELAFDEELDYSPDDLRTFQLALHLLETCRVVQDSLNLFDGKVRGSMAQLAGSLRLSKADPTGPYIPGTTRGEATLLSQSILNSADLHSLLDSLELPAPISTPSSTAGSKRGVYPTETSSTLLMGAKDSLIDFTRACQLFLQDTILSPLNQHLSSYSSLPVWTTAQAAVNNNKRGGTYDLQIPTFSLSPSHTIQRVGEGLLNLPRVFEVYADDDSLSFSIETLPFVDLWSLRSLLTSSSAKLPSPPSTVVELLPSPTMSRRLSITSPQPTTPRQLSAPSISRTSSNQAPALSAEMVSSTWLSSLTLSLLSNFTSTILPSIPSLQSSGATAQLASDLAYISNIVRTMNVEWDELEKWKEAVEIEEDEGKGRLAKDSGEVENVLRVVGRLRGWNLH